MKRVPVAKRYKPSVWYFENVIFHFDNLNKYDYLANSRQIDYKVNSRCVGVKIFFLFFNL